jgi:hypothetical protein
MHSKNVIDLDSYRNRRNAWTKNTPSCSDVSVEGVSFLL